jgi:hypothetical protein
VCLWSHLHSLLHYYQTSLPSFGRPGGLSGRRNKHRRTLASSDSAAICSSVKPPVIPRLSLSYVFALRSKLAVMDSASRLFARSAAASASRRLSMPLFDLTANPPFWSWSGRVRMVAFAAPWLTYQAQSFFGLGFLASTRSLLSDMCP